MPTRLSDTILTGAFTGGFSAPMVDIRQGGQLGYAPNFAAINGNAAYVQQNVVALVVEAPRAFDLMPDPEYMRGALKALFEVHPREITGLARGLTANFVESQVGGGGELLENISNVERARTQISLSLIEKYGRPMQTFLEYWITDCGMDPDTKIPRVATYGTRPTDLLPDMVGATVLFFEPDPTFQYINKAFLTTNIFPRSTGDIQAQRSMGNALQNLEFTVEFTGVTRSDLGIQLLAQTILDGINLTNANPNLAPAFVDGISADVAAIPTGYVEGINNLSSTAAVRG